MTAELPLRRVFVYHSVSCVCQDCLHEDEALGTWNRIPYGYADAVPVSFRLMEDDDGHYPVAA